MGYNKSINKPEKLGLFDKKHLKYQRTPLSGGVELTDEGEEEFMSWYRREYPGINPDPDSEEQYYDYRSAWAAGDNTDSTGHGASKFKKPGHPNLFVKEGGGTIDSRTGKGVTASAILEQKRARFDREMRRGSKREKVLTPSLRGLVKDIERGARDAQGNYVAYLDKAADPPRWTIGHGHAKPGVKEGMVWTPQQADQALSEDLAYAAKVYEDEVGAERFDMMPERHKQMAIQRIYNLGEGKWKEYKRFREGLDTGNEDLLLEQFEIKGHDEGNAKFRKHFWPKGE